MKRTAHEVVADVRMTRSLEPGTVLLVEGPSDMRLLGYFLLEGAFKRMVAAWGKLNVKGALEQLDGHELERILAVVDDDFAHLNPGLDELRNLPPERAAAVVRTDQNDADAMMLYPDGILQKILINLGPLTGAACAAASTLREELARAAAKIGAVRYVSKRDGLSLNFKGLEPSDFADPDPLGVKMSLLIDAICRNTLPPAQVAATEVERRANRVLIDCVDAWGLACGHDLTNLLSFWLATKGSTIDGRTLEQYLKVAYGDDEFRRTGLYRRIRSWEEHNARMMRL